MDKSLFKLIGITLPDCIEGEGNLINALFSGGIDRVHLRKPKADIQQYRNLIRSIDPHWYPQITLHDYFELAQEYHLGGIHLNSRNSKIPDSYSGFVSKSFHHLAELSEGSHLDYYTLSPIFDSISKQGYLSNFSSEDLCQAREVHLINNKTIALGGITCDNLSKVRDWGFGGCALLGYLWQDKTERSIQKKVFNLRQIIENK